MSFYKQILNKNIIYKFFRGGEAWTRHVKWEKSAEFGGKAYDYWLAKANNTQILGEYKHVDRFVFLKVFDAGHM